MPFTDDDLKQLKEDLPIAEKLGALALRNKPDRLSALLARLEAAEAYIYARSDDPYQVAARYDDWRKACGK